MTTSCVILQFHLACHLTQTYAIERTLLDKPSSPMKCNSSPLMRQAKPRITTKLASTLFIMTVMGSHPQPLHHLKLNFFSVAILLPTNKSNNFTQSSITVQPLASAAMFEIPDTTHSY
jgi:hypothetical protein